MFAQRLVPLVLELTHRASASAGSRNATSSHLRHAKILRNDASLLAVLRYPTVAPSASSHRARGALFDGAKRGIRERHRELHTDPVAPHGPRERFDSHDARGNVFTLLRSEEVQREENLLVRLATLACRKQCSGAARVVNERGVSKIALPVDPRRDR